MRERERKREIDCVRKYREKIVKEREREFFLIVLENRERERERESGRVADKINYSFRTN